MVDAPLVLKPLRGRLLIVDDDEAVSEYLRQRFSELGMLCATAANGIEAIHRLLNDPAPEVILLDLNMPGIDGIEFLRLAEKHIGRQFGVITMTGCGTARRRQQAIDGGAAALIEKPIDFAKLVRLVKIQQAFLRTCANIRRETSV
jgi:CheY-like chemotaxis protein